MQHDSSLVGNSTHGPLACVARREFARVPGAYSEQSAESKQRLKSGP